MTEAEVANLKYHQFKNIIRIYIHNRYVYNNNNFKETKLFQKFILIIGTKKKEK